MHKQAGTPKNVAFVNKKLFYKTNYIARLMNASLIDTFSITERPFMVKNVGIGYMEKR